MAVPLLQDGHARLAVFPADRLIDLPSLALRTGATKITHHAAFMNPFLRSCWGAPPLPGLYKITALVDMSVRNLDFSIIPVPGEPYALELSGTNTRRLLEDEFWDSYTRPLEPLVHEPGDDLTALLPDDLGVPRYSGRALYRRLNDKHEFPVMSSTAKKILELQSNPDAEVEDLAAVVDESPTLAAQVVKWANSPYYGFPGTIRQTADAIMKVLGFDLVLNMALGIAIGKSFQIPLEGPVGLHHYWEHALCCASLNTRIAKALPAKKRPPLGAAYLCGLLHNFGFLLVGELFPKHFRLLNEMILLHPHLSVIDLEHAVLGVAHDRMGSWLMQEWSMPPELIAVTQHHHWLEPSAIAAEVQVHVAITHLSVSLLARRHLGDGFSAPVAPEVLACLDLTQEQIEEILVGFDEELPQLLEMTELLVHM